MSKPTGNLLTNTASLFTGTVGTKVMSLVVVMILSRYLGVEDFGRYSLIFNFWALLNTLIDIGTSGLLGRDIAQNINTPGKPIQAAIYIRLLGSVLFLPLGYWIGLQLHLSPEYIFITFLGLMFGFEAYYDCYFSAKMKLNLTAKSRFFASVINLLGIIIAVLLKAPLFWIILIALSTPLMKLFLDIWYTQKHLQIPVSFKLQPPDLSGIKSMFLDSWPLWLVGVQYIILARVDTFLLVTLSPTGSHDLGIYSAAFRFSEMLALVINSICPSLLPLLVRARDHTESMQFLTSTGIKTVVSGVLMVSLIIFWYAPWIVQIFYGSQYTEATQCIQILVWSQALVAVNTLCYQTLMVYNAQGKKPVLIASVLVVLLNIGLNIWLIPHYKAIGSSWATVITEIAAFLTMAYFMERYTPNKLFADILKLEAFCLLSCLPVMLIGWQWGILSCVIFTGLIILTKTLNRPMLRKLANLSVESH